MVNVLSRWVVQQIASRHLQVVAAVVAVAVLHVLTPRVQASSPYHHLQTSLLYLSSETLATL